MPVSTLMHRYLENLESAKVQVKSFSLETQDQNAKTHYSNLANQLENVEQNLKDRIDYVEQE